MKRLYVAPLWGSDIVEKIDQTFGTDVELVFTGGYVFFAETLNIIDRLLKLKADRKIVLNQSRLETYFKVVSGISDEQNYLFRRWINPFSGIMEPLKVYGLSEYSILSNPEEIPDQLKLSELFKQHYSFYQELQMNLIPVELWAKIETSIQSKKAFSSVAIYDEDLKITHSFELEKFDLDKIIHSQMNVLSKFQYGNFEDNS